ncbi:MAG: choice-of-anchor Q domain-containing protein [Thiotrichaceae bacterium]|nr:choice-of-anchor Q domain-containing protein [Thiotrichaceae bacterium]
MTNLTQKITSPVKFIFKSSICALILLANGHAFAATITVDNTTCTLPNAITSANTDAATGGCTAGSGDDIIDFDAALSGQTITLAAALPNIASNIAIDGSALASHVKISGANTYRVFYIASGTVALNHLDIINGKAVGASLAGYGAAILQLTGILTLSNSTVSGHSVTTATIYSGGTLTINGSTISNNAATGQGGGVFSFNPLTVTNSTFSNNTSSQGAGINAQGSITITNSTFSNNNAGALNGGAIQLSAGAGSTVSNSTFSGNLAGNGAGIMAIVALTVSNSTFLNNSATSASGLGGGIASANALVVNNSTFLGNSATVKGGGIAGLGASTTVSNSTFSNNSASGASGQGGGIFNNTAKTLTVNNSTFSGNSASTVGGAISNLGTLNLENSILANSTNGGDCVNTGTVASGLNNVIKDSSNACGLTGTNGNKIGVDPLLGALANNGGLTQTFALLTGSPAINAGDAATCISTDQRGTARAGVCDIGAFEAAAAPSAPTSAPLDFSFSHKQPEIYSREIKIK